MLQLSYQRNLETIMTTTLRITDTVTTCDCCGKTGLKCTVEMELDNGDIVHYGRTCASRNSGKNAATMNTEIKALVAKNTKAAKDEYYSSAEYKAELDCFNRRGNMLGKAAMEFCEAFCEAAQQKRNAIAKKYDILSYTI